MTEPLDPAAAVPAPRRRIGRPPERKILRTQFDAYLVRNGISSRDFQVSLEALALSLNQEREFIPTLSSIEDMRVARMYPSLVRAWLISIATKGEVNLETWAADIVRIGTRYAKRKRRRIRS